MRPNPSSATASAPGPSHLSAAPSASRWLPPFVLLAVLWGASFLFMRLGASQFGAVPTAGLRVILAALFLLPVMLMRGEWPALRQHWKPVLFSGIINSAIPFSLFAYAVVYMPTGMASVLNACAPLFGALVAWLWLGDRITGLRVTGLLIGFSGVALLALHDKPATAGAASWSAYAAIAACLCASLSYGVAASFAKRYLVGVPPLATATGSMIGASLCLLVPTVAMWPSQTPSWTSWLAVAALALLCTSVAYSCISRSSRQPGPAARLRSPFWRRYLRWSMATGFWRSPSPPGCWAAAPW